MFPGNSAAIEVLELLETAANRLHHNR